MCVVYQSDTDSMNLLNWLTVIENLCHRQPLICSSLVVATIVSHFPAYYRMPLITTLPNITYHHINKCH